jgi:hypothetical protein
LNNWPRIWVFNSRAWVDGVLRWRENIEIVGTCHLIHHGSIFFIEKPHHKNARWCNFVKVSMMWYSIDHISWDFDKEFLWFLKVLQFVKRNFQTKYYQETFANFFKIEYFRCFDASVIMWDKVEKYGLDGESWSVVQRKELKQFLVWIDYKELLFHLLLIFFDIIFFLFMIFFKKLTFHLEGITTTKCVPIHLVISLNFEWMEPSGDSVNSLVH